MSVEAIQKRARLLLDLERAAEALQVIHQALAQAPDDGESHEIAGLALIRLHKPDDAIAALKRAIACRPAGAHAYYLLGFAFRDKGLRAEALVAFNEALRLRPTEPVYLRIQAELLCDLGRGKEGLVYAERAVAEGPDRAANFVTLGYVTSALGEKAGARAAYEAALRKEPTHSTAWNNLACLDLEQGRALLARHRFREALRCEARNSMARKNLDTLAPAKDVAARRWDDVLLQVARELVTAKASLSSRIALWRVAPATGDVLLPPKQRLAASVALVSLGAVSRFIKPALISAAVGAGLGWAAQRGELKLEVARISSLVHDGERAWQRIYDGWLAGQRQRRSRDAAAQELAERVALQILGYDLTTFESDSSFSKKGVS